MVLAGVLLAAPAIARAANCTPDPAWGTPNTAYAAQVAVQLNQQRAANGLGPLLVSPLLTTSAEWKSLHMAYYGYLDHNDPAPPVARTAEDRIADCGYTFQVAIGENIADGFSSPSSVVAAWMGSDGHRANILGASFTVMGVGVAADSSGAEFWTVDFGGYTDPGSVSAGADPTPPARRRHPPSRSRPRHRRPPPRRHRRRARPRRPRPRRPAARRRRAAGRRAAAAAAATRRAPRRRPDASSRR